MITATAPRRHLVIASQFDIDYQHLEPPTCGSNADPAATRSRTDQGYDRDGGRPAGAGGRWLVSSGEG